MSERKVAFVTGALGGIGSEICRQLVKANYKVIATVVPREEDREKQWLKSEGFQQEDVRFVLTDLTHHADATSAIQDAIQAEGRVDVLVNNAGITRDATFKKMSFEQWSQVIDTNLKTLFTVTHPVFNKMLEQKQGRIVNISSVNGLKGQFGQANYSAAKAGLIGLTKALAKEVGPSNIRVNCIAPGLIDTEMNDEVDDTSLDEIIESTPIGRIGKSEDVVNAMMFLASDASEFITGQIIGVSGGLVI